MTGGAPGDQTELMWRALLSVLAALLIALPALARAQYQQEDRRDRTEYTQEDSHPLKLISYVLAPIGFVLDWAVGRPLHYLTTGSPLAPVFNGGPETDENAPPPIAELPPIIRPRSSPATSKPEESLREEQIPPAAQAAPPPAQAAPPSATQPPAVPAPGGQPVLH